MLEQAARSVHDIVDAWRSSAALILVVVVEGKVGHVLLAVRI